jgi:ketosteroid isomerase-like protein
VTDPVEIVRAFFDAINAHDPDRLAELMADGHVFTDSLGASIRGRQNMHQGWRGYFAFCPDYRVSHEAIFRDGERVSAFGSAGGTVCVNGQTTAENKWHIPAAWRVVVHGGRIGEFQVYADNRPVYDILAKSR